MFSVIDFFNENKLNYTAKGSGTENPYYAFDKNSKLSAKSLTNCFRLKAILYQLLHHGFGG